MPGVVTIQANNKNDSQLVKEVVNELNFRFKESESLKAKEGVAMIILCDDAKFTSATLNNFLWVSFTRCNPANDIYGINEFVENKHWGCDTVIIDARIKPHHAPPVEKNPTIEKQIDKLFAKGGSLYGII
jgi:4-hydroxy-3-polyprenylbenzoate decarboxylase